MKRLLFVLLFALAAFAQEQPAPQEWRTHLESDLMRFWLTPEAMGEDGNFPTYRCNDGSLFDAAKPCPELADPIRGIVYLDRDYLRMQSRQVYGYGVAYHMTGDERYLELARKGAQWMMRNGFEQADGKTAPISWWKNGKAAPRVSQRTSQDMAYAMTGLGFYYYLTRDPEALRVLKATRDFIFGTHYDEGKRIIRWVEENYQDETTDKWELTAQLDQVYAYMIWLAPALPVSEQESWKRDLLRVSHIMKDVFYAGDCGSRPSAACGLFWGDMTETHTRAVGENHTDYGHSVKTMWMIYTVGRRYGDKELEDFGRRGALQIIEWAYDRDYGSWYRAPGDGSREWWAMCELDQTAGSLGLENRDYARYVPKTFRYYRDFMVDKEHGEVWHLVTRDGKPVLSFPKQHAWKNMMHSTEHALVGYITSSELHDLPAVLYFAWSAKPEDATIRPYVYDAKVTGIREIRPGRQAVTFEDVR